MPNCKSLLNFQPPNITSVIEAKRQKVCPGKECPKIAFLAYCIITRINLSIICFSTKNIFDYFVNFSIFSRVQNVAHARPRVKLSIFWPKSRFLQGSLMFVSFALTKFWRVWGVGVRGEGRNPPPLKKTRAHVHMIEAQLTNNSDQAMIPEKDQRKEFDFQCHCRSFRNRWLC